MWRTGSDLLHWELSKNLDSLLAFWHHSGVMRSLRDEMARATTTTCLNKMSSLYWRDNLQPIVCSFSFAKSKWKLIMFHLNKTNLQIFRELWCPHPIKSFFSMINSLVHPTVSHNDISDVVMAPWKYGPLNKTYCSRCALTNVKRFGIIYFLAQPSTQTAWDYVSIFKLNCSLNCSDMSVLCMTWEFSHR